MNELQLILQGGNLALLGILLIRVVPMMADRVMKEMRATLEMLEERHTEDFRRIELELAKLRATQHDLVNKIATELARSQLRDSR